MLVRGRKMNRDALAGVDALQCAQRGLYAGPEERQAMGLGNDEVGRHQWNSGLESIAEEAISLGMVLVAPAAQRDPGAAIDEQSRGSGGGAGGTVPAARQRTSRSDSDRSSRSERREGRRWRPRYRTTDPRRAGAAPRRPQRR